MSSSSFVQEMTIPQPMDKVFPFVANPVNRVEMFVNVVEVEKISEGEIMVGSKFKEIRQLSNRRVSSELELVEFEQDKLVAIMSNNNGMKVIYRYKFEETDSGTHIRFEGEVIADSLRTKLMRPLIVRMVKSEDSWHIINVREALAEMDQQEKNN